MSVENLKLQEVVSVFIRSNNGSYLLQLRDKKPSIAFPGHWGLFGGAIENGESVCEAASRELEEEIKIVAASEDIHEGRQYIQSNYKVHTCFYDLKIPLSKGSLQEGMDLGFFPINKILKGKLFSQKFNAYFPIADPVIGYFNEL